MAMTAMGNVKDNGFERVPDFSRGEYYGVTVEFVCHPVTDCKV